MVRFDQTTRLQDQASRPGFKNYVFLIMALVFMPFVSNHIIAQDGATSVTNNSQIVNQIIDPGAEEDNSVLTYYCSERSIRAITATGTDDCCAEFYIINECQDAGIGIKFQFEIYNSITDNFEIVTVENMMMGEERIIKLCAINGESFIKYRIRIFDTDGVTPMKEAYVGAGFAEGENQLTGDIAVNCCPCPPNVNDYFTIEVIPGACPNNGCKVVHRLELPDSLGNCFKYFKFENSKYGMISGPYELWDGRINNTMLGFEDCIEQGEFYYATIYFLRSKEEPIESACKITNHGVGCFNIPQPEKELCKPDCFDDEWGEIRQDKFATTNCPNCLARVSYTWRHACNNEYQDLQISKIEFLSDGCKKCDIDMLYRDLLGSVVALDVMQFKPIVGEVGCNTTWRIANGGCWVNWSYYVYDNGKIIDTITVYEPCDSVDCCLQPMTVCRDKDQRVTITIDSANGSAANCTGKWIKSPTTGETLPCNPACDWLAGLNGEFPYQDPKDIIMQKEQYEEINYSNAYGIRAEVNDQEIKVNIKTEKSGVAKIAIFDIQGREIIAKNLSIYVGISQLSISTSGLSSGIYIYTIEIDGMRINTDKFSIVR